MKSYRLLKAKECYYIQKIQLKSNHIKVRIETPTRIQIKMNLLNHILV